MNWCVLFMHDSCGQLQPHEMTWIWKLSELRYLEASWHFYMQEVLLEVFFCGNNCCIQWSLYNKWLWSRQTVGREKMELFCGHSVLYESVVFVCIECHCGSSPLPNILLSLIHRVSQTPSMLNYGPVLTMTNIHKSMLVYCPFSHPVWTFSHQYRSTESASGWETLVTFLCFFMFDLFLEHKLVNMCIFKPVFSISCSWWKTFLWSRSHSNDFGHAPLTLPWTTLKLGHWSVHHFNHSLSLNGFSPGVATCPDKE